MKGFLFFAALLVLPQVSFSATPAGNLSTLCPALNGKWEGHGRNVYYGEYTATWTGTCSLAKNHEFLKGELLVKPVTADSEIRFSISASKYDSTYSSPIVMKLTEKNPLDAYPYPGVGEEETLIVNSQSAGKMIGWREVALSQEALAARGLRVELNEKSVLNFGLILSETYCGTGSFQACISDRYMPFLLDQRAP